VPVEVYLAKQPSLSDDSQAVLDLILHEVLLRQERGEAPSPAEYFERFPHLEEPLAVQFAVEQAIEGGDAGLDTRIWAGEIPPSSSPAPPTPPMVLVVALLAGVAAAILFALAAQSEARRANAKAEEAERQARAARQAEDVADREARAARQA
jgi:hypothetical protein